MRFIYKNASAKPGKTVYDLRHLVRSGAELYGDKTLYLYKEGQKTQRYSYARLWDEMNCIGTALAKMSLDAGGAAVTGSAHPQWVTAYLSSVNSAGYIVPLDSELSAEQTLNFLRRGGVETVFYTGAQNEKIAQIASELENVKLFVPINPDDNSRFSDKVVTIGELIEMGREELKAGNTAYLDHKIDMEKMCSILFTSGTTGTSKGVMLSQHNLTAAINGAVQTMPFDESAVTLSILPMHHAYELTCEHLSGIAIGAQICINDSIKNVKRNLVFFKPNGLEVVPVFVETMYKRIWEEARKKGLEKKLKFGIKLSNALLFFRIDIRKKLFGQVTDAFGGKVEVMICGGAPLASELIKDFYALGIIILEGYGITECAPLVSVNSPEKIRLHSVGHPIRGCSVKIDRESDSADGKIGEILVKGENVMLGYYKDPEATRAAFTDDGWFRTGDFGYIDNAGYIYITGRKKNIIILSNGKNVYPEELEEYLYNIDLIDECVVLERNRDGTPVITAIVVPNEELTEGLAEEEIYSRIKEEVNQVNSLLPVYKNIGDIEIRKEKFERNTSQKILRHKVQ